MSTTPISALDCGGLTRLTGIAGPIMSGSLYRSAAALVHIYAEQTPWTAQGIPHAYGQVRSAIPFSCAYFAADASTKGRTSA